MFIFIIIHKLDKNVTYIYFQIVISLHFHTIFIIHAQFIRKMSEVAYIMQRYFSTNKLELYKRIRHFQGIKLLIDKDLKMKTDISEMTIKL